jgi:hypothetical protein
VKGKVVFIVGLIMVAVVLSAGSLNLLNPGFSESRKMLIMRDIGHQLLISAGDSTSRVLPVRKLDDRTFLIEFENNFSFVPDSLVTVVHRTLGKSEFPAQYSVHVMGCFDRSIVYAFERNSSNNIIPCLERKQPSDCYAVQITFAETFSPYNQTVAGSIILVSLLLLGFVVFTNHKTKPSATPVSGIFLSIGQYKFYPDTGMLQHPLEIIELSRKETTLLKLFAENVNQLLLRDRLLKEVWEDEGVVTGRSLDMFVSKLRKKLRHDPAVNLVSAHGKGYRLEVS